MLRRTLIAALLLLVAAAGGALALEQARFAEPPWAHDRVFEFGVYERGQRRATAYYRVLHERADGADALRFKYSGSNDSISEASEVLVRAAELTPIKSTRKVVYSGRTFFQDISYVDALVRIRKRYEGESVREHEMPAPQPVYDYEQLIWLVPLIDFPADNQARFEVFSNINELVTTVIVTARGQEQLELNLGGAPQSYPAQLFTFDVGLTPYRYWLVMQNGVPVPGRIDMGQTSFVNLKLSDAALTPYVAPVAPGASDSEPEPEDSFGADEFGADDTAEDEDADDEDIETVDPLAPPPDLGS